MEQQAHARRTDPATSHRAAEAVTPGLNAIQAAVEKFALSRIGGFLDVELVEALPDLGPSTVRTRRSELVDRNVILDSGSRRTPDGATTPHTVWIHRNFVPGAPPICEPPKPASPADKAEAATRAADLDRFAVQMKAEGRAMFHDALKETAALLRRLSV